MNTIIVISLIVVVCLWLTVVDPVGKQAKVEWEEFKKDYPEVDGVVNSFKRKH